MCSSHVTDVDFNNIIAKGNEFNELFKIIYDSSFEKDMINNILNKLLEKYPKNFNDFVYNNFKKEMFDDINDVNSFNSNDTTFSNSHYDNFSSCSNIECNSQFDNYSCCSTEYIENFDDDNSLIHKQNLSTLEHFDPNQLPNDKLGELDILDPEQYHISYESNQSYEILLDPKKRKLTAYPIEFHDIWKYYKDQAAAFWTAEKVPFGKDYSDFQKFNPNVQHFIKMVIAFFANSDGIVNWNLSERFTKDVQITEALFTYQYQIMMENIHSEVYSLMLEQIITDPQEKTKMFNAIYTIPSIKLMADWAFKWIQSDKSFAHRLVAFAIVEGIFFSGAFAAIFWIKSQYGDVMQGLLTSNEWIARDEGLHCEFACVLYSYINNRLSNEDIYEIMSEAVTITQKFMTDALPVRLIGMNQKYMDDYIEYIADILLDMLDYKKLYGKKNPFDFMAKIGLSNKSNFFEKRTTDYQDESINNETRDSNFDDFTDDF